MPGTSTVAPGSNGETFEFDHERLAELMKTRGLVDADVAKHIGTARATVHRIRKGSVTPSLPIAAALAAFFKIPLQQLVKRDWESE